MSSRKKNRNPKLLTAQEFVSVEDISDGILYSTTGYLFGYLSIRAGDTKLLSEAARAAEAANLASVLGDEREPWQLLSIPRTIDTLGMIEHLAQLRKSTREDARLKLIAGEIAALQAMSQDGTKEPLIVLKCWSRAARGADAVLKKRLQELRAKLTGVRISADLMEDTEIVYICKLFADLTAHHDISEPLDEDLPIIAGTLRRFTRQRQENELLNLITPVGGLSFGASRVTVGSVVGRVYGAIHYPAELDYGWAVDLMNSSDCVTCMMYTPGNVAVLGDALSRSIRRNSVDAYAESDARRKLRLERQAEDAQRLIEDLDNRSAAVGHLSLLVMPITGDEAALEDVCRTVVNRYSRKRIKLKSLGGLQREGFQQLSPYHINQAKIDAIIQQIIPLETVTGGFPMTVNIYRDDSGCFLAYTLDGGVVSVDFLLRGRDRANGNIVVTGGSGQGKSTALKHISQSHYMRGIKTIVIDPEREYRDLCRQLNGTWLDAGGGVAKINPLQIRPAPQDEEETEGDRLYSSSDNAMSLHIHTLEVFFKLYLPSLSDLQRAHIKQALVELYGNFGITWDTDVAELTPEQFPLLSDLYTLLQSKAATDARYEEVAALFYDMAEGADSFLWNGHTNVAMDNNFICLDTNRLMNSSDEIKRAQYFNILTLCWETMSADRDKPVFLLCDEAHILLDPAIPQTAMFLRNFAKRARKYEGMLCVVLQSVVDALHEQIRLYGQAIMDNSAYKFLFGCDGKNLRETAELFGLTEAEQNILLGAERGTALCFIGSQRLPVEFIIPKYKLELMGSGGGR